MSFDMDAHLKAALKGPKSYKHGEEYGHDEPSLRMQKAHIQAAVKGCIVVLPKPNELFVDIDSADALATFKVAIKKIEEGFTDSLTYNQRPSPSGREGRFHITVTLPRNVKSHEERILLQALLGSDPIRELVSWGRVQRRAPEPTLFFEKPEVA